MDYIVFDLEWNQCPYGKKQEDKHLPFEIIDIGAVKLDENRKIKSTFHEFVKPKVYKKLHFRTKQMVGITQQDIDGGRPFREVASDFLKWCGDDFRFCSWGDQDTAELQRNLKYYDMQDLLKGPMFFEDVQKLYSIHFLDGGERCSLEHAVDQTGIKSKREFHQAYDDAVYTAHILTLIPDSCIKKNYSVDFYQNPKSEKEEIYLEYDDHDKFISREFDRKEEAMKAARVRDFWCPVCHTKTKHIIKWTAKTPKNYISLGECKNHGFIKGKIKVKTTDEGKYFVVKSEKEISEKKAQELIEKIAEKRDIQRAKTAAGRKRHVNKKAAVNAPQ